jgi:hypothetical protein
MVQTPALQLLHEIFHYIGYNWDPSGYMQGKAEYYGPYPKFPNAEEARVTLGPETWAANELGEATRKNYSSPSRVRGPVHPYQELRRRHELERKKKLEEEEKKKKKKKPVDPPPTK